jgi:hypothetical protein
MMNKHETLNRLAASLDLRAVSSVVTQCSTWGMFEYGLLARHYSDASRRYGTDIYLRHMGRYERATMARLVNLSRAGLIFNR